MLLSNQWPLKALNNYGPNILIHTPPGGVNCLPGAVRVMWLAQGHLDTQLGGVGDQTSKLPVASNPTLPPQPLPQYSDQLCIHVHP